MDKSLRLLCATLLTSAASCQSDPPQQVTHSPVVPPITASDTASAAAAPQPIPVEPVELKMTVPAYLRSHRRYVGAVSGQEFALELMPVDNRYELVDGSLYFVHDPHTELFAGSLVGPGSKRKSLKIKMSGDTTAVTLELLPPFGPRLRALWTAGGGVAPQPVALHESYAGAVRYEVLTAMATGKPMGPQSYSDEAEGSTPSYTRAYLHLLGPDTLRPGLRRLQALTPRRMQKAVGYYLRHEAEGGCRDTEELYVMLNGYDLLSYHWVLYSYMFGGAHPESTEELRTVDLRTGRRISPETWFRAGSEPALRQLIYRQLLVTGDTSGYYDNSFNARTGMRELPDDYGLNPAGIVAHYGDYVLGPHAMGPVSIVLPFAEVAPMLRPGTPLDRILAARGLWAGR